MIQIFLHTNLKAEAGLSKNLKALFTNWLNVHMHLARIWQHLV